MSQDSQTMQRTGPGGRGGGGGEGGGEANPHAETRH